MDLTLEPGRSLSHYKLMQPIGQGGMGVVWRAQDTSLGRDVALKVLPEHFARDPERMARFEREARLLAALNHPAIAAIYGLHSSEGTRFLAMEIVEGQDLAQRLAAGALPVDEAMRIGLQVAEALEHAHEKGIVHRDLKPANVKLTAAGSAKVLDFGLAKALAGDPVEGDSAPSLSQSPTLTGHLSGVMILGTAAYMSPEQARGHKVDRRADIWAYGVLLLEMLTGERTFSGETISDTLASVLKTDPDWQRLPSATPPRVRRLLQRCLERNPRRRLRDIGEARIVLEDVLGGVPEESPAAAPMAAAGKHTRGRIVLAAGLVVALVAGLGIGRLLAPQHAASLPLRRFHLLANNGAAPSGLSISPDGHRVAYVAEDHIWVQGLDELAPRDLGADPGAKATFWSPDGAFVGYLCGNRVMKIAVRDGARQTVCDTPRGFTGGCGATWTDDGTIILTHAEADGMLKVPALGGDVQPLFAADSTRESDFHTPAVLPGKRGILFVAHSKAGPDNIGVWSGGKRQQLLRLEGQTISNPVYCPSGHILFERAPNNRGIWALPFSLDRLATTGEPFLVAPQGSRPSVANDGTLVYVTGVQNAMVQLAWVDRNGKQLAAIGPPTQQSGVTVALAPDGVRVAYGSSDGDNTDVWVYDTARGTKTRLTFEPTIDSDIAWSPAGDRIYYQAREANCASIDCWKIMTRAADGGGSAETLLRSAVIPSLSPDGRFILYTHLMQNGTWDLLALPSTGGGQPLALVPAARRSIGAAVSPDGRYFAYGSNESGRWELFLKRFPSGDGKWQVSVAGGLWPHWNRKGDRLYYAQGDDIMEVDVQLGAAPTLGTPRKLFARQPLRAPLSAALDAGFAVTGDGEKFVILAPVGPVGQPEGATVVQNWLREFSAAQK